MLYWLHIIQEVTFFFRLNKLGGRNTSMKKSCPHIGGGNWYTDRIVYCYYFHFEGKDKSLHSIYNSEWNSV